MSKQELKPCPFCGGNDVTIAHQSPFTELIIICYTCKAMVCFPWDEDETGFDLAWNRRANNE